ncbi:hypothetical protein ACG7TL_008410 [Trametes sanguinea]
MGERQQALTGPRRARAERLANKVEVRVATLNINGFGSLVRDHENNKWGKLYRMMQDQRIGVLMMQETHLTPERRKELTRIFADRIKILHSDHPTAPQAKEGVAFVLNKRIVSTKGAKMTVMIPGRAAQLSLPWRGGEMRHLLCVYAPTSEGSAARKRFFEDLKEAYETRREVPRPHLMAGDFNVVEDAIDRYPVSASTPDTSVEALDDLKRHLGLMLTDGWRARHGNEKAYTFQRTVNGALTMSRLDRIYVRSDMLRWTRDWQIRPAGVRTDHNLVAAVVTTPSAPETGKGRPVFPMRLLKDKKLAKEMKARGLEATNELTAIRTEGRTETRNAQLVLHELKKAWLEMARKREKSLTPKLTREISELEAELDRTSRNQADEAEAARHMASLTEQIRERKQTKLKQQQQGSRAKHKVSGEIPTKYWVNLHKEHKPRELIPALEKLGRTSQAGEPEFERDATKMAELAREHYDSVQRDGPETRSPQERERDTEAVLKTIGTRLNDEQRGTVGGPIDRDECQHALKHAKSGTAPGLDGIQYEVWKTVSARYTEDSRHPGRTAFDVLELLEEAFRDVQDFGECEAAHFTEGWMTPIYKEKGDLTKIVNYRPITLLNTDYKLMSKALAIRLAAVAPSIIHPAQAGFVPGRRLKDHTQLARLMIDWAEAKEINGVIVALDQEKAYDRIDHGYLWRVMKEFGLPESFVQTVQNLYEKAKTSVTINGLTSKPYAIYRGVRQGDPLSCLLFDIAIEPLSIMLRGSEIKGLAVPGMAQKIRATLFADDTTVYLSEEDDFSMVQNILDVWCSASKAKFNIAKTELIPIGNKAFRERMVSTHKSTGRWMNYPEGARAAADGEPVRILGAFLGNGIDQAGVWTPKLEKIQATLDRWGKHHTTLPAKKHVVQMVAGGMTQFLAEVQSMPTEVTRRLAKIIRGYLWEGRRIPPISDEQLHKTWSSGGIDLLDLQARNDAIQIMWLKSYLAIGMNRQPWAYVMDDLMAMAVAKDASLKDRDLRMNCFLQGWSPKASALPKPVKEMMAAAKKYGVRQEGIAFSMSIIKSMPMWGHKHARAKELNKLSVNSSVTRCLKKKHGITTVGDAANLAEKAEREGREHRARCSCAACEHEITVTRCAHPGKCFARIKMILSTLPPKWNPRGERPEEAEDLNMNLAEEEDGEVAFDRRVTVKGLVADTFRVFTSRESPSEDLPSVNRPCRGERVELATDGSCVNNGQTDARAGAGIFVAPNSNRNKALRLPADLVQTNQTGEIAAVLAAMGLVNDGDKVRLVTDSKTVISALTKLRRKNEDNGYIGVKNGELLKATVAAIQERAGHTTFKWVKGHSGHPGNEAADALAAKGANKEIHDDLPLNVSRSLMISGAKLSSMTQKLAYRAIRTSKERLAKARPSTQTHLDEVRTDLAAQCDTSPTNENIWRALRKKNITREIRQFLWRVYHDSFMLGRHWLRATMPPELRERAECGICGGTESIQHILLECQATERTMGWELLRVLWERSGEQPIHPTWGTTVGAPSIVLKDEAGARRSSVEARWMILATETAYFVWKMRCERVIQNQGVEFSAQEVATRWLAAVEGRMKMDLCAAREYLGKRAPKRDAVEAVWKPLLDGNSKLNVGTEAPRTGF